MDGQFVAFCGLAAVLTLTPGADTALVLRNTLAGGRAAGIATTLGISAGCLIHAVASALGLSLILARSAMAFEIVKIAGAAYLVWLGIRSLRFRAPAVAAAVPRRRDSSLRDGLFTNLLNPKVAIFYLTLLPQFVSPEGSALGQSLLLAGIHIAMGLVWLSVVATCAGGLSGWLASAVIRRRLEALTGILLIGLGARLALERR